MLLVKKKHVCTTNVILSLFESYAAKAGGQGDRYTVMVDGHEKQLFFEHSADSYDKNVGRWFVERKG